MTEPGFRLSRNPGFPVAPLSIRVESATAYPTFLPELRHAATTMERRRRRRRGRFEGFESRSAIAGERDLRPGIRDLTKNIRTSIEPLG